MDTLVITALIVAALVVVAIFFALKYGTKSGGKENVWKPGEKKGPHPEG
jgi:hypothetical protein